VVFLSIKEENYLLNCTLNHVLIDVLVQPHTQLSVWLCGDGLDDFEIYSESVS